MADITTKRDDARQEGILIDVKLAASVILYAGTLVSANSSGLAKKGSDTSGEILLGVAMETVDSTKKSYIRVWREGVFDFDCSGADQTWVGQNVYIVDNHTVALAATTTNDVLVGRVIGFNSATSVRIKI
ncbi:capsid cement protein [Nocardia sp. NPDC050697]|uniref:capsid cement protein n=1 Tax=Nocardia sp. NPDC050697 TaxID=3155158 RepID=UPI0033C4F16D